MLIACLAAVFATAAGASAGNGTGHAYGRDGVKAAPPDVKVRTSKAKRKELRQEALTLGATTAQAAEALSQTPPLGTVRPFVATNFTTGGLFLTNATLRGMGEKIEVWVQNNRAFPAGDCRNTNPVDTTVTDEQIASLIEAFDTRMFPIESELFSTPPDRDGSNNLLGLDYSGDGDKIVTLVMNIRD